LPFYFVIPVYLLWAVTFGIWLVMKATPRLSDAPARRQDSLVQAGAHQGAG
jgi:hypothetical protein